VNDAPRVPRKESFDAAASDYALYRSGYPDEVVDDVVTASRLHAGSRVLEIGCDTGQLSVPLAQQRAELVPSSWARTRPRLQDGALLASRPPGSRSAGSRSGRCQPIPRRHTTLSYVGWLKTASLVLSLGPQSRRGFRARTTPGCLTASPACSRRIRRYLGPNPHRTASHNAR
jgi:hypothetical protein